MNFSQLDPREIEYMSTLEWESLMIYLEKKYGIEFKEDVVTGLKNKIQNRFNETGETWKN